jgi:hypothetical protein
MTGESPQVAALEEEVMEGMLCRILNTSAGMVLFCLLGASSGWLAHLPRQPLRGSFPDQPGGR